MGDRWIVGFDGSPESRAALAWAARNSADRDVELDVVHAHVEPLADRLITAIAGRRATHADHDDLDRGPTASGDDGDARDTPYRVVDGAAGRVLVDAAADGSLLVVGRHGAGGGWRHALGSVSRFCVWHSVVPTIVVPTGWADGSTRRIVVGFDGSPAAARALRWAIGFARPGEEIVALTAIEIAPWLGGDLVRTRLGDEVMAEEQRLRDLHEAADPDGRTRQEVVIGDARPALAHAAAASDLVVLGTHGAGRHGSALVGSVAAWMLDGSPTPIVVVPASPTDRD